MADPIVIECPVCRTGYRPQSLGFSPSTDMPSVATVRCVVCQSVIDAGVTPVVSEPGWISRVMLRQVPETTYEIVTKIRTRSPRAEAILAADAIRAAEGKV